VRTLGYFATVGKAVADAAEDPVQLASIADGFFTEVAKRLQSDTALDLLRNGVVCRTIETALLAAGSLLQCKSIIYLLLGKTAVVMTSPTASYLFEASLASIACSAQQLVQDTTAVSGAAEKELSGDVGLHASSGVPSTRRVLEALVDEVVDSMESIMLEPAGSRCIRALIMCLAGSPAVLAKLPPSRAPASGAQLPFFPDLLTHLAEAFVRAVEKVFAVSQGGLAAVWLGAATTVASSCVLQTFLQHACGASQFAAVAKLLREDRLERLRLVDGTFLLSHLMLDPTGSHVFQAYLRARDGGCWRRAFDEHFLPAHTGEGRWQQTSTATFILQDFVTFAPDETALQIILDRLFVTNESSIFAFSALAAAAVRFSRKCAHGARKEIAAAAAASPDALPADDAASLVAKDIQQGAPYFRVGQALRSAFVLAVCGGLKASPDGTGKKGAAHALLVGHAAGSEATSYELALNMLLCGRQAAMQFAHSFDKLRVVELSAACMSPQGTHVMQQLARLLATDAGHHGSKAAGPKVIDASPLGKFQRRLLPCLGELARNKYGAYLVEALYDVGGAAAKEELVSQLAVLMQQLRDEAREKAAAQPPKTAAHGGGGDDDGAADNGSYYLSKVLLHCCVEQFVVNAEQWRAVTARQAHVRRLMHTILATEGV
jgi:hypothetical protein